MAKVLITGAGICGLGAALLLARDGHDVTILERDDSPFPDSAEAAWDSWSRKGVAQFRQPHNFMPGLRMILEAELPDLQDAMRRAGATKFDLLHPLPPFFADQSPRPIDDKLWTYTALRPTGEWVFANAARHEPRITVRRGVEIASLLRGPDAIPGAPHVAGLRTTSGEEFTADFVVDASGRASRSSRWLADIGARPPYEEQTDSGFTYYTRFFRGKEPERRAPILTVLGTISILTLPADNGAWSVTIFTSSSDTALKPLHHTEKWTSVISACPLHAHWLDGKPLTDVLVMSGVVDRYRRFVVEETPVVTGFFALADAWACTNPSAGRGITVGFIHAMALRKTLREAASPQEAARRFDDATETDVTPWYRAQIAADRYRFAEIEALRDGRRPPAPEDDLTRDCLSLFYSMAADPDLFRAGLEYVGTVTPIQDILKRPAIRQRIGAAMQAMADSPPPALPGPDRKQLLQLVGAG